jgi:hypothetical protein
LAELSPFKYFTAFVVHEQRSMLKRSSSPTSDDAISALLRTDSTQGTQGWSSGLLDATRNQSLKAIHNSANMSLCLFSNDTFFAACPTPEKKTIPSHRCERATFGDK